MAKSYEFHVEMTCQGCVNAVERILQRKKGAGVDDFKVDLPMQLVTVLGTLDEKEMTELIAKCGKDVTLKSVKDE